MEIQAAIAGVTRSVRRTRGVESVEENDALTADTRAGSACVYVGQSPGRIMRVAMLAIVVLCGYQASPAQPSVIMRQRQVGPVVIGASAQSV